MSSTCIEKKVSIKLSKVGKLRNALLAEVDVLVPPKFASVLRLHQYVCIGLYMSLLWIQYARESCYLYHS